MKLKLMNNIDWKSWDEYISGFDTSVIFHKEAWLRFLEYTQKAEKHILEIREKGELIGYFAGLMVKKGPFKILGSPLIGWTTESMGPIVNKGFDQESFLEKMERHCKQTGIDHLEISSPILKPSIMEAKGFQMRKNVTPIVKLSPDQEIMWKKLKKKSCRYPIKKAEKSGVKVEETHKPEIIDEFYNQLIEVFARRGLVPTYSRDRVMHLFNCLGEKDMLFALKAKYDHKVIATGLFPHDENTVYYWGGASYAEFRPFCPNELIQWTLMKMAAVRGIKEYNMYGGDNTFKMKFGAELNDIYHWYKSYNPLARAARVLYQSHFRMLQRVKGAARKKVQKINS